jgi:hypothetical protein
VYDNQGIFGLIEQGCSTMIVSDGSGQLPARTKPPQLAAGVLRRASDISMDAVRRNAFRILALRERTRRLKDLRFIHLKSGMPTTDVTWVGGIKDVDHAVAEPSRQLLNDRAQRALAAIRTDLDRFSPIERDSLMYAGYRLTQNDFDLTPFPLADHSDPGSTWTFMRAAAWMDAGQSIPRAIADELECGQYRFLRRLRTYARAKPWMFWARN